MFSLLCAMCAYFLVRYAKGGRKTLHLLVNPPVLAAKRSISSTSSTSKWFWSILIICIHVPSFSYIPPISAVFPLESPGFLQLQRQHQRLRALSALVPRPGSGEFPFRAAATAQRHHVGCHRGRHAAGPGTFGAPSGHTTFSNSMARPSGDGGGKSWKMMERYGSWETLIEPWRLNEIYLFGGNPEHCRGKNLGDVVPANRVFEPSELV